MSSYCDTSSYNSNIHRNSIPSNCQNGFNYCLQRNDSETQSENSSGVDDSLAKLSIQTTSTSLETETEQNVTSIIQKHDESSATNSTTCAETSSESAGREDVSTSSSIGDSNQTNQTSEDEFFEKYEKYLKNTRPEGSDESIADEDEELIVPSTKIEMNNANIDVRNSSHVNIGTDTIIAPIGSNFGASDITKLPNSSVFSSTSFEQNGETKENIFSHQRKSRIPENKLPENINVNINICNPSPFQPPSDRKLSYSSSVPTPSQSYPSPINVSGCKDVNLGPQVYILAPGRNSQVSEPTEDSPDLRECLNEFREALNKYYDHERQSRSFFPWHRNYMKLDDYYTKSLIYNVNKKCGSDTEEQTDLVKELETSYESRLLVEGEVGMGKTLLAINLAHNWAMKHQLQKFQILIMIYLRNFQGSIEEYVKDELLAQNFDSKS